jgi:DNA-directed RNA polymerase subunit beta'
MLSTTMGQILVNEPLPPEMRDYSRKLDKKGIKKLFQDVAERYPDRYRDIAHQLSTVAHQTAFRTGGFSFGLKDLMIPPEAQAVRKELDAQVQQIMANRKLKPDEKNQLLTATLGKRTKEFEDVLYRRTWQSR